MAILQPDAQFGGGWTSGTARFLEDGRVQVIFGSHFLEFQADRGIPTEILRVVPAGTPPVEKSWASLELFGMRENPGSSRYSVVVASSARSSGGEQMAIFDWEENDLVLVPAIPTASFGHESLYLPESQFLIINMGGYLLGMDPTTAEVLWNVSVDGNLLDYPSLVAAGG